MESDVVLVGVIVKAFASEWLTNEDDEDRRHAFHYFLSSCGQFTTSVR